MAAGEVQVVPLGAQHYEAWCTMREALFEGERRDLLDAEAKQITELGTLKGQPFACFIALIDTAPVGFAEATVRSSAEECLTSPVVYLEAWYVAPQARGSGVGRELLDAVEEWGTARGCREMASDTRTDNDLSLAAHLALGFEDAGVIRCFRKSIGG